MFSLFFFSFKEVKILGSGRFVIPTVIFSFPGSKAFQPCNLPSWFLATSNSSWAPGEAELRVQLLDSKALPGS